MHAPMLKDTETARLACRDVDVSFGALRAVQQATLFVGPGEIVAILGPSGCGKSTLLRAVAGLQRIDSGGIVIDGQTMSGTRAHVAPERRNVGMMFQDVALFPHLTVLANVAFGLPSPSGRTAREIALRHLAEVGLAHRAGDYPSTLSGGEAQRVALARAIAPKPRILLLDEPFSSLDTETRGAVQREALNNLRQAAMSAVMVTHDRAEAFLFADRIAVMHRGRIVQTGSAQDLYRRPESAVVARALGNVVECSGVANDGGVDTPLGRIPKPRTSAQGLVSVLLRSEAIAIATDGTGIAARVTRRTFTGANVDLTLYVDGMTAPIVMTIPADTASVIEHVRLLIDLSDAMIFTDNDEA